MLLGTRGPSLPACPHRAVFSRQHADRTVQRHHLTHLSHTAARLPAPRRGSLLCEAAKRPNSKKKASQKPKAKATVKDRPQAPESAPAQGGTSTKERSEQRHAEEQAQEQQQEQPQQASAVFLCILVSDDPSHLAAVMHSAVPPTHREVVGKVPIGEVTCLQAEAEAEAEAEADPEPVRAATQQVAEPGAPADTGDARRQQQVHALLIPSDGPNVSGCIQTDHCASGLSIITLQCR